MLTQDTKRKIDSARDILVGKVPDPKAQVEQITTALIYKFMDDMDKESQDLGGKARFFAGEYEKYAWHKLMDPRLGGQERLNLYVEAITKFSQNPHLPQLFRDIFKDAFLPFRDPQTLNLFLKEINGFTYDHSEDLGDAFEYLLSILGSQGDAGQFRTPRHIIDFIVAVVDPKKDETVCDPACGTAGFLISSYKHILKNNQEPPLTPDERKALMDHFVGYDISPDMVRLSKVNMYLHGFPNPTIFEYDTLTNEEKWEDMFDVMLANPPFMTPKGGIRPHKRFGVQANRAEVLFVDYILEHLKPQGRAGIIVPEGIIFQSANAYKTLRKKLVEDGLFAVVSLPSGVFQPYSGVKTSILFFDKNLTKNIGHLLFVDVKNTGISLGAAKVPIKENDLPQAKIDIEEFKKNSKIISPISFVVDKKTISNNNYDLSLQKYKNIENKHSNSRIFVSLKDIANLKKGKSSSTKTRPGKYPLFVTAKEQKTSDHFDFLGDGVAVPLISSLGHGKAEIKRIHRVKNKFALANLLAFIEPHNHLCNPDYLYYCLDFRKKEMSNLMAGAANVSMKIEDLENFKIPLPPLEVQQKIVDQIETKQRAIDAAKAVIAALDQDGKTFGDKVAKLKGVEWVALGEVANRITKGTTPTTIGYDFENKGINFIKIESIGENGRFLEDKFAFISTECHEKMKRSKLKEGDVLFSIAGAFGRVGIVNKSILPANTNQALAIITLKENVLPKFVVYILRSREIFDEIKKLKVGVAQYNISLSQVANLKIPLPPLDVQQRLVAEMEEKERIAEANKKLIEIMEREIQEVIESI